VGFSHKWSKLTVLHPSTNIWVSSAVHFFLCFFSAMGSDTVPSPSVAILRILPLFSGICSDVLAACASRPVSSRKLQAGTRRGDDCRANDTRLCFIGEGALEDEDEEAGKGALKEKVDADGGLHIVSVVFSMLAMTPVGLVAKQNRVGNEEKRAEN
jgi:hypothetical protein